VRLTGSDTKALEALSHPDLGILVYYRRQAIAVGAGDWQAQVEEEIYAQVEKMIANFKTLDAFWRLRKLKIHVHIGEVCG
jgi:hypothetical protein